MMRLQCQNTFFSTTIEIDSPEIDKTKLADPVWGAQQKKYHSIPHAQALILSQERVGSLESNHCNPMQTAEHMSTESYKKIVYYDHANAIHSPFAIPVRPCRLGVAQKQRRSPTVCRSSVVYGLQHLLNLHEQLQAVHKN